MKILTWIKNKWRGLINQRMDDHTLAFWLSIEIASFIALSYGLVKAT